MKSSVCLSLAFGLVALATTPTPGAAVIEAVFKTAEVLDSKNWTEGEPHLRAEGSPSPLCIFAPGGGSLTNATWQSGVDQPITWCQRARDCRP